jgi:hypothetical protein
LANRWKKEKSGIFGFLPNSAIIHKSGKVAGLIRITKPFQIFLESPLIADIERQFH